MAYSQYYVQGVQSFNERQQGTDHQLTLPPTRGFDSVQHPSLCIEETSFLAIAATQRLVL